MAKAQTAAMRVALALLLLCPCSAKAQDALPYREGTCEKGELKYIDGLPLLVVQGTPEEMGRQQAGLTADAVRYFFEYPGKQLDARARHAVLLRRHSGQQRRPDLRRFRALRSRSGRF